MPALRLPISPKGQVKEFENRTEFLNWLSAEEKAWTRLFNLGGPFDSWVEDQTQLRIAREDLARLAFQKDALTEEEWFGNHEVKSKIERLSSYFREGRILTASSPQGKVILELAERDPQQAAAALGISTLMPGQLGDSSRQALAAATGVFHALSHKKGFKSSVEKEKEHLDQLAADLQLTLLNLRDTYQQELEELKRGYENALGELGRKAEELLSTLSDRTNEGVQAVATLETTATKHIDELMSKAETEIESFKTFYNEQLALRGPITYWTDKSKRHVWHFRWIVPCLLGIALLGGGVIIYLAKVFFGAVASNAVQEVGSAGAFGFSGGEVIELVTLLTIATFVLWTLRILVRVLLSNIHLSTDASERAILLQTYLALLEEGKVKDEDRQLLLATVFRPSSTGIVRDDAAPELGLPGFLSRAVSKP